MNVFDGICGDPKNEQNKKRIRSNKFLKKKN